MIDSDNVLLLRPASRTPGFVLRRERPPPGSTTIPAGLVVTTIYYTRESGAAGFSAFYQAAVAPALTEAGAALLAVLVTEDAPNNFPRLPVREGEQVLVSFTAFSGRRAYNRHQSALADVPTWHDIQQELRHRLSKDIETLRLQPTARSLCTAQIAIGP